VLAQAYGPVTFTVQAAASGLLAQTRSAAPKLIGEKSNCRTTTKAGSSRSCTYTFTHAARTSRNQAAIATASVNGHRRMIAAAFAATS
jgi:hypothetical protein